MMLLLIAHAAATWWMVGLIWFVQVVHYPLMGRVGPEQMISYELAHQSRTSLVVGPPMLVEFVTAALLVYLRPAAIPAWSAWLGVALVALLWLSTAVLQVPQHERLARGFDAAAHGFLVQSNWLRTVGWTARGVLAGWMLVRVNGS